MIDLNTLRELKAQKKEVVFLDESNNPTTDIEKAFKVKIGDLIADRDHEVEIPNSDLKVHFITLAGLCSSENVQYSDFLVTSLEENSKNLSFHNYKVLADYIDGTSDDLSTLQSENKDVSPPAKPELKTDEEKFPTPPDSLLKRYMPETPNETPESSILDPQVQDEEPKPLPAPEETIAKAPSKENAKNFDDFSRKAYTPFPKDPEGLKRVFEEPEKNSSNLPKGLDELITKILCSNSPVPVHFNDKVGPPIILVNNDPIAAVNLINVEDFLLGRGFKKYDPSVNPESEHPKKVIIDRNDMKTFPHPLQSLPLNPGLPFQFEVVDNKYELTDDFLNRVVAIFGTGRDLQFGRLTADKVYHLEEKVPFFHLVPPHTVRQYNREDQKVYPKAVIYDTNFSQSDWSSEGVDINSTRDERYQKRYYDFLNVFWSRIDKFIQTGQKHYVNKYPYWLPNHDIIKSKKRRTDFEKIHGGTSSKISRIDYDMEFAPIDWSKKQIDDYKFMDDNEF